VATDSRYLAEPPAAQGQRCAKCKGKKWHCERCSDHGKAAAEGVQEYDFFELPFGAGVKEVLDQLSARAGHCRRLIVAQHTSELRTSGPSGLAGIRRFLMNNKDWIVSYSQPGDRLFFVLSRDPRDRKPLASKLARAANFARAVAIHIGDGGTHVTAEQLEQRLATCVLCDSRSGEHCSACGCSLLVKARWRTSKCPLNKWPKVDPAARRQDQSPDRKIPAALD
jgi:hypothetical protein